MPLPKPTLSFQNNNAPKLSITPEIVEQVNQIASNYQRILACLDYNHTHEHVLEKLKAYAPLTTAGSYCVVFDTIIEDMPADILSDRPWGAGKQPENSYQVIVQKPPGI